MASWNRYLELVPQRPGRDFFGHYEPEAKVAEVDKGQQHCYVRQTA